MTTKNPYAILGLRADADSAKIRSTYYQLAREYHPDHNPDSAERFQDINWAWNILRNKAQKEKWDLKNGITTISQPSGGQPNRSDSDDMIIAPPPGMMPQVGADMVETVHISMQEAYRGGVKQIIVNAEKMCEICGGSASAPGHMPYPCTQCGGKGFHKAGRLEKECRHCNGKGLIIEHPCTNCHDGRTTIRVEHSFSIPKRTRDGQAIVIEGEGLPGWARPGDLIIEFNVSPSLVFHEMTDPGNLMVDVPITWSEAVLGGQVTVPTPEGPMRITLPAGTPSEQMFRLRGLGLQKDDDGNLGDLFARTRVLVPKEVSPELRRQIAAVRVHENINEREKLLKKAQQEWQK